MLNKYERLGFKIAHQNARYGGRLTDAVKKNLSSIAPLKDIAFEELCQYDRLHFPADRQNFLKCWINQPEGASLGYIRNQKLCGYGVIRACHQGFKIAPLFANEIEIAETLFLNLATYAKGESIYIDTPTNNSHAYELVHRYRLEKIFETARMYLKKEPSIINEHIYGITSFELG